MITRDFSPIDPLNPASPSRNNDKCKEKKSHTCSKVSRKFKTPAPKKSIWTQFPFKELINYTILKIKRKKRKGMNKKSLPYTEQKTQSPHQQRPFPHWLPPPPWSGTSSHLSIPTLFFTYLLISPLSLSLSRKRKVLTARGGILGVAICGDSVCVYEELNGW